MTLVAKVDVKDACRRTGLPRDVQTNLDLEIEGKKNPCGTAWRAEGKLGKSSDLEHGLTGWGCENNSIIKNLLDTPAQDSNTLDR